MGYDHCEGCRAAAILERARFGFSDKAVENPCTGAQGFGLHISRLSEVGEGKTEVLTIADIVTDEILDVAYIWLCKRRKK